MSNETTRLLRNPVKEKLSRGETVYSMTVRLVRTVDIAAIAHTAGFDSVYIDMEHSPFSLEAASQICMACNHLGVTPLVRVPGLDPSFIARVMDAGAMGIIVPGVQSADEARTAVRAVKHVPLGSAPWRVHRPNCTTGPSPPIRPSANSTSRPWWWR